MRTVLWLIFVFQWTRHVSGKEYPSLIPKTSHPGFLILGKQQSSSSLKLEADERSMTTAKLAAMVTILRTRGGSGRKAKSPPSKKKRNDVLDPEQDSDNTVDEKEDDDDSDDVEHDDVFTMLAHAVQDRLDMNDDASEQEKLSIDDLVQAFESLAKAQQTFKGLDGVAHEAYQRTHTQSTSSSSSASSSVTQVSGRASRVAARTSAVALALGACELCELVVLHPPSTSTPSSEDPLSEWNATTCTLSDHYGQVLCNETIAVLPSGNGRRTKTKTEAEPQLSLRLLVLFDSSYQGGAGVQYGAIDELVAQGPHPRKGALPRGRLVVVLGVDPGRQGRPPLDGILDVLSSPPRHVRLADPTSNKAETNTNKEPSIAHEAASVQPILHTVASQVLHRLQPILQHAPYNQSAIHFVGHDLAGGVACIAATILQGQIPLDKKTKARASKANKKKQKQKKSLKSQRENLSTSTDSTNDTNSTSLTNDDSNTTEPEIPSLQGFGRGRTSAVALGGPPCISSNVPTEIIVSILAGDDLVGRATSDSLHRLFQRTWQKASRRRRHKTAAALFGQPWNRMADTWSLASSNLKTYVHGSEGEEARLAVPGRAFLIRPRRLGHQQQQGSAAEAMGSTSIHEFGSQQVKGGREAIRASILWQLNDILVSRSMWKHHQLNYYIQALDRVHIRGLENADQPPQEEEDDDEDNDDQDGNEDMEETQEEEEE